MKRHNNRRADELRPISITHGLFSFAAGSVLFEQGRTKILCAVNLQNSVPPFLRGKNGGWLNAEYALMPASTMQRTPRESTTMKRAGRSVEISRLIGRALRMAVDLSSLGERTLQIDCDVLQADGGTRTASINAAYVALCAAQDNLLEKGIIEKPFVCRDIAAVSIGILNDTVIIDPDYHEDSNGDADINMVVTRDNELIEIQGGAEGAPFSWEQCMSMQEMVSSAIKTLFAAYDQSSQHVAHTATPAGIAPQKAPIFSLKNRQNSL